MGFNPYGHIAAAAEMAGDKDTADAARQADRTQKQVQGGFNAHPLRGAIAGRNSLSLPGIRTQNGVIGSGLPTKAQKDASGKTIVPAYVAPSGFPSIKVQARETGEVDTTVQRFSIYTAFISAVNWRKIEAWANKVLRKAEALSRGRLSLRELARRNHPYGIGLYRPDAIRANLSGKRLQRARRRGLGRLTRMAGISNLAVTNKQTGEFQRSWVVTVIRSVQGIVVQLSNLSDHAFRLLGSQIMRAHGPFLTAVQLYLHELDVLWRKVCLDAYRAAVRPAGGVA